MSYVLLTAFLLFIIFLFLKFQNKNTNSTASNNLNDNTIIKAQKNINPNAFKTNEKVLAPHNFVAIKIIDNDNELEKIVPDFERRKEDVTNELISRLGGALPNDVIWGLLQQLYLEFFINNHKIFLNTAYQQGLLLQKEKKYKQAISHYSYGLYYLMNFYNAPLKPTAHIIDFVSNETQLIEMAQQKFINKIQLCIEYENLNLEEVKDLSLSLINRSPLPNLSSQQFIMKIQTHLHSREKNENKKAQTQEFQNLVSNHSDLFQGLEFHATIQFRTPLEVLKHHGEIYQGTGEPPKYAKEQWHGMWLPVLKEKYDLFTKTTIATDLGALSFDEVNLYLDFLIKFHTIAESELDVEEKIVQITKLNKNDSNFHKYYKSFDSKEFLESYFNLLIKNILPAKATKSLNDAGYRTLKDLKGANPKELLKLDGIGKATIDKLSNYL